MSTKRGERNGGKRPKTTARREDLLRELSERLVQLDGDLSTTLERFRWRERGRLQALLAATAEAEADGTMPGRAKVFEMLELLEALEIKPERGRTRDLVAVHRALKKLESLWLEG